MIAQHEPNAIYMSKKMNQQKTKINSRKNE